MKKAKTLSNNHERSNNCCTKKNTAWRILWGLFFLIAAAGVILSALNIITFGFSIGWVLLCALLAAISIASLIKFNWFCTFMSAAGILTILICQTDYLPLETNVIFPIWCTATLLSIGFSILFHRNNQYRLVNHIECGSHNEYEQIINSEDNSEIAVDVNLGSTIKYVNTDDFKYALLKCNLGSIKAYFDNAVIKGDSATIEIRGSLSGIELYIPKNWTIANSVNATLSGVEEHNNRRNFDGKDEKTIYLTGSLTMSGVEITYI